MDAVPTTATTIRLNGRPHAPAPGACVADLVRELGLAPEQVAVEKNGVVVRRAEHATTRLENGDQIEIVTLVGGG